MQKLDLLVSRVPFTTATALRAGWSEEEIGRNVRSKTWTRLRHGVLLATEVHVHLTPTELHRAYAVAHQLCLSAPAAGSHRSAAVLLGLPVLREERQVQLTSEKAHPRARSDLRLWQAPLPDHHRTRDAEDVLVTAAARTVVDVARAEPLRDALVVADAALHRGLCTSDELGEALAYVQGWPGARGAVRVCGLTDGRAESPGETLTRVDLLELGHADLVPQVEVVGLSGRRYRADFLLPRLRVLVEFDGAVKYNLEGRDVLLREKWREDDLRLAGYGFVRRGWNDLGKLEELRRRIDVAARSAARQSYAS